MQHLSSVVQLNDFSVLKILPGLCFDDLNLGTWGLGLILTLGLESRVYTLLISPTVKWRI